MAAGNEAISVLVADDSEEFLEVACSWIDGHDSFRLAGLASEGAEAVSRVEALKPDLVLMDARMPGMDGFQATRRIKALADAPWVVIVSLYDSSPVRLAARAAGADGFVSKAELHERLPAVVRNLALRTRPAGPPGPDARADGERAVDENAT
jgi:CheY-like chemotaxis protein